jgi:hypothetical protein
MPPNARPTLDISRAQVILLAGDALIFVFFAVAGRATHEMGLGASPLVTVLAIAAPFAVSWFILAWVLEAFRPDTFRQPRRMLFTTAFAWLSGGSIGLVARTMILQRPLLPTFAAVVLGINGVLLLGWRFVYSLVAARAQSKAG